MPTTALCPNLPIPLHRPLLLPAHLCSRSLPAMPISPFSPPAPHGMPHACSLFSSAWSSPLIPLPGHRGQSLATLHSTQYKPPSSVFKPTGFTARQDIRGITCWSRSQGCLLGTGHQGTRVRECPLDHLLLLGRSSPPCPSAFISSKCSTSPSCS